MTERVTARWPTTFHVLGHPDHPLGKRSIWVHADGSGEMLSEAFGLQSVAYFKAGEGKAKLEEMTAAYAAFDEEEEK
jgi:hypothetical protein